MFRSTDTVNRMMAVAGATSDSALARALDVSKQTVAAWRLRDSIPLAVVVDFAITNAVSLDFLLLGRPSANERKPLSTEEALRTIVPLSSATRNKLSDVLHSLANDIADGAIAEEEILNFRTAFLGSPQ